MRFTEWAWSVFKSLAWGLESPEHLCFPWAGSGKMKERYRSWSFSAKRSFLTSAQMVHVIYVLRWLIVSCDVCFLSLSKRCIDYESALLQQIDLWVKWSRFLTYRERAYVHDTRRFSEVVAESHNILLQMKPSELDTLISRCKKCKWSERHPRVR